MCNPAAAYWIVTAVTAAYTAKSQHDQGEYEKGVSRYNSRVLENQAVETRNKGVDEEMRHREKVQQLISKQRAISGASGVNVDTGSPLQLQTDAELIGEVDALRIRQNFSEQAEALDQQAVLTRIQGDNAYRKGRIGAMTALGQSFSNSAVSNRWYTPNSSANTQGI